MAQATESQQAERHAFVKSIHGVRCTTASVGWDWTCERLCRSTERGRQISRRSRDRHKADGSAAGGGLIILPSDGY
jgi:hypothetical protein